MERKLKRANGKISLPIILEYLILICFIYGSTMATWQYRMNNISSKGIFTYALYAIVVLYVLSGLLLYRHPLTIKQMFLLFSLIAYSALYSLLGRDLSSTYWVWLFFPLFLLVMFCIELRRAGRLKQFIVEYLNIIVVLSIVSLIFYIGGEIIHAIPHQNVVVIRPELPAYSIPSYFGLTYIGQEQTVFGITFSRNTGLFLEGPSWGSFLWPAFFAELFVRDKIKKSNCFILLLTVISTFSLGAIIFCLAIIGLKYIKGSVLTSKIAGRKVIQVNFKILFVPVLFVLIGLAAFNLLQSKSSFEEGSIIARVDDTIAALKTWLQYPLLGCGFGNEYIIRNLMTGNQLRGNTAGILKVFAMGGLAIGIEYIGGIILFVTNSKENKYNRTCFGVILLISMFISSTYYSLFNLFFVACGLSYMVKVRETVGNMNN